MYGHLRGVLWQKGVLTKKKKLYGNVKKNLVIPHVDFLEFIIDLIPKKNGKTNLSKISCDSNW